MEDKFQNKYRVSSPRLQGWDYGSHALYFVTICIKDRLPAFGEIWQNEANETTLLKPTMLGNAAHNNWLQIPHFHPYVELDEFVIMPTIYMGFFSSINPVKLHGSLTNQEGNVIILRRYYEVIKDLLSSMLNKTI